MSSIRDSAETNPRQLVKERRVTTFRGVGKTIRTSLQLLAER